MRSVRLKNTVFTTKQFPSKVPIRQYLRGIIILQFLFPLVEKHSKLKKL
jgi:hypothetical protein